MSRLQEARDVCYEDAPKVIMSRVVGANAVEVTQATISSLAYWVDRYESLDEAIQDDTATSITSNSALTPVSSYIYNTLQTDNDWAADSTGYNFKMTLPAASFPTPNKWYKVEVWATPSSGEAFPAFIGIFECVATVKD